MSEKFIKGLCIMCTCGLLSCYAPTAHFVQACEGYEACGVDQIPNVEVKATYSGKFQPLPGDSFCITYESKTGEKKHIRLDASLGMNGYAEDGTYQIIGINYVGANQNENSDIKNTPVASNAEFRVQGNEMTRLSLAIGEQAVKDLTEKIGKEAVYKQEKADSVYDNSSTPVGVMFTNENPQAVLKDPSMFEDDPEAKQRYTEQLEKQGLVDENLQYTDKAEALMREEKEKYTPVGADVIKQDDPSPSDVKPVPDAVEGASDTEKNNGTGEISGSGMPASGEETAGEGEADIKVKHFDKEKEETKEEEKEINPIIKYMFKYLPMMILFVGMLLYLVYQKKK